MTKHDFQKKNSSNRYDSSAKSLVPNQGADQTSLADFLQNSKIEHRVRMSGNSIYLCFDNLCRLVEFQDFTCSLVVKPQL